MNLLAQKLLYIRERQSRPRNGNRKRNGNHHRAEQTAPSVAHILCISYDEALLETRKLILERAGFKVTTAHGLDEAIERCGGEPDFDLIVMGHSIPRKDKSDIFTKLHNYADIPMLSIRRHGDDPVPEATYSIDSEEGPQALIDGVREAIRKIKGE
jgi:CheY-like chemotaxis protein